MNWNWASGAAAAGLSAMTVPCVAQSTTPPGSGGGDIVVFGERDNPLELETATGSRLGITALQTPASVAALDGDEIRGRGDLTVLDAVTRAPGVTSTANPGNGGTALALRGFSGQGSVLQLYDGVRLFPVAGTITFPVDPWNVERVEVLSGPASVLYGQGALGGAVNVITRAPDRHRLEAAAEAGYGSQDSWRVAAGAGGPLGAMAAFRLDASYRRSDGYVDRGDSKSHAIWGALLFAPAANLTLTLRGDYGNQRPIEYFGTPLIAGRLDPRNRRRNYNVADADLHYRDGRASLRIDWEPADAIVLTSSSYRLTSKRLFKNLESYFFNDATGLVDRFDNLGIVHDQVQYGNQTSLKIASALGGTAANDLVLGFDADLIKLIYSNDFGSDPQEDSVDPFSPEPGLFFDTQGIAPRFRTRTRAFSLFAEDRLQLSERLSLVGGLRYERNTVRRWNISPNGVETPAFPAGQDAKRLRSTTGRIGAVFQPRNGLSLYAQYATGVDPLGTLTTFTANATQFFFSHAPGNQVEAGVKAVFLGGRGSATLAAYRIVKRKLVAQRTPTSPVEQVGQRSARGIEASLILELPGGFGFDANATILDARFDEFISGGANLAGKTPANTPETSANVSLRWDVLHRLQARGSLRYVGRTFSDDSNRFRVPAYFVVDAGLSYAVTPNVAMSLRASNLFDRDYATTTYNNEQWLLGRPRSVDFSVSARF